MTLTTLRKRVEYYRELVGSTTNVNAQRLEQLRGLPFYDWNNSNNLQTDPNVSDAVITTSY